MHLSSLSDIVLETLDFFENEKNLPKIHTKDFHFPLILGSGNGFETGKILFRKNAAFFASESEAEEKLAIPHIEEVVIISASGEKHAPILADMSKKRGKKTILISSKNGSSASKIADESYIFPKIAEPYTYNTSTYFGYIYESEIGNYSPKSVKNFIENDIKKITDSLHFADYEAFFVVIPNEFALLKNMVETKFIELFGRKVARDVATFEQMKHATTVVPHEKELFITFGNADAKKYGKNQVDLPIFDQENYGAMMMIAYWTVGQIQNALPPYFMDHIADYCEQSEYHISPLVK